MKLGKRLKQLLADRQLSQREFGRILGLSEGTISNYIKEERQPSLEVLQAMADYFGVTLDYLVGRTNDPKGYIEPVLPEDWEQTIRELTKQGLSAEDVEAAIELIKAGKKMREG